MNEPDVLPQQQREYPEPFERTRPVPWFVLLLAAGMVALGVAYILQSNVNTPSAWGDGRTPADLSGDARPAPGVAGGSGAQADGAAVYASLCVACHQATGAGLPGVFPPLAGSEWVVGKDSTAVAIVLQGINGSLTVKGAVFAGAMPSFKAQLSDEQVAAVLSHVRSSFGNSSPPVEADTVARVRESLKARSEPFAGDADLAALR